MDQNSSCNYCKKKVIGFIKGLCRNNLLSKKPRLSCGNKYIDEFIQDTMSKRKHCDDFIEWIPCSEIEIYDLIIESGNSKIFNGKWDPSKREDKKKLSNINIVLKLKIHYQCLGKCSVPFYGLTKPTRMQEYAMIMKYTIHGDLNKFLNSQSKLSWIKRVEILQSIAKSLNELHKLNIIHRDFHSGNILVDDNMEIFISDFGLSMFVNDFELSNSADLPSDDPSRISSRVSSRTTSRAPSRAPSRTLSSSRTVSRAGSPAHTPASLSRSSSKYNLDLPKIEEGSDEEELENDYSFNKIRDLLTSLINEAQEAVEAPVKGREKKQRAASTTSLKREKKAHKRQKSVHEERFEQGMLEFNKSISDFTTLVDEMTQEEYVYDPCIQYSDPRIDPTEAFMTNSSSYLDLDGFAQQYQFFIRILVLPFLPIIHYFMSVFLKATYHSNSSKNMTSGEMPSPKDTYLNSELIQHMNYEHGK
ncbi:20481_t:CDS:2 [Gigaspora margarita]|uniref:20481_t:CDS:1 n=1 Tax=Gigaspora margarita TaxID=4874 RepID=A0ABM8VYS2_GIGMA|nr:20481_t:CDS:2 [Gigaspora margarita]